MDWIRNKQTKKEKKQYLLEPPRLAQPRRNQQPPLPAEPADEETQWPPARPRRPCRPAEAMRRRRSVCPRRSTPWCWSCTHLAVRPARGTAPVPAQQASSSGHRDHRHACPLRALSAAAAAAGSGALDSSSAPTPATATPTIYEPPPPRRRRAQVGVACCHASDDPPSITYDAFSLALILVLTTPATLRI